MTDRYGNHVEAVSLNGRPTFRVTGPTGHLLGAVLGVSRPEPTTVDDLVALGVDIASLA